MKKSVIIILAILPFFLLIVIAFAGRIISAVNHVPVERVEFISEAGEPYGDDYVLKINRGGTVTVGVEVYPKVASNKETVFSSSSEAVFTVDGSGRVTGVGYGTATLTVTTKDSAKTDTLYISVTDENVQGVQIEGESKELLLGEANIPLVYAVTPYTALNKNVTWQSSAPHVVKVDQNGKLTALSLGEAVVTVTTVDGGHTDSITVTVVSGTLPIEFDFSENPHIGKQGEIYFAQVSTVDLKDYIRVDSSIGRAEDVVFALTGGGSSATLTEGVLSISQATSIIRVKATVAGHSTEIKIVYNTP